MHLCHPMMNPTHHYIINKESISSKNRRKPVIKTSKVWRINENSLPLPSKNGTDAFLMPSGIHFSVKNQQKAHPPLHKTSRKDAGVVDRGGLENRCTAPPYPGFESLSFRNLQERNSLSYQRVSFAFSDIEKSG